MTTDPSDSVSAAPLPAEPGLSEAESAANLDAYLAMVRTKIDDEALVVQHVLPAGGGPGGYSYTLGLTDEALPELWIDGLRPKHAAQILEDVAVKATVGGGVEPGVVDVGWSTPLRIRGPVAVEEAEVFVASQMWPHPYVVSVMQVCWPDTAGRFPDDDGYDGARFPQRLLGLRGETL